MTTVGTSAAGTSKLLTTPSGSAGGPVSAPPPRLALPVGLVVLGLAAAVTGLVTAPARTLPSLLVGGFYLLSLSVSGLFFITTQRLTSARWSAALRRIPEALAVVMPIAALLLIPLVLFGGARQTLFSWSRPGAFAHASEIAGKAQYLQPAFVYARIVVVLGGFGLFAWLFRRTSLAQDRSPAAALRFHGRLNVLAGLFIVFFALGITASAFDWIASLDPSWFSTMFAVYVFAGMFVSGNAAVSLATVRLMKSGLLHGRTGVGEEQLHDLGKLMFAFSVFWAYIWVSQYLLIWYGNIPDEITHYQSRTNGAWLALFGINVLLNWVIPFLALMSVPAKRSPRRLSIVAISILVGHWLDLYILIVPALSPGSPHVGLLEVLIAGGYGALLYLAFRWNLSRAPLIPVNDPVLAYDLARLPRLGGHAPAHAIAERSHP